MTIHDEVTDADRHYRRVVQLVYTSLRRDGWAEQPICTLLERWGVPEAVHGDLHDGPSQFTDLEAALHHAKSAFWDAMARANEDA